MAILAKQKILTLDYWKLAHHLQKGDIVFDRQGYPRKVTLVQEFHAPVCYSVVFDDNLELGGDQNLNFLVENKTYRRQVCLYKGVKKFGRKLQLVNVRDLIHPKIRYSLPTADPIKLPHQNLPVPPFIFGFWFFNRRSTKMMAPPKGMSEAIHGVFKDHGYKIREHELLPYGERTFSVKPTIDSQLVGIETYKIPTNYLMGSDEQRIELLKGIIQENGHRAVDKKGNYKFISNNHNIILQMQWLLESLGHRIHVYHDTWINNYKIKFASKLPLMPEQTPSKSLIHNGRRYIQKIKKVPGQLCVHIETDGPDNTVLVEEGFIACL
jgi:hypothetical protein